MSNEYQHNHYVPQWYQKRFLIPGQKDNELYYLDLHPTTFKDPRGISHVKKSVRKLGPRFCFAEDDLYTRRLGFLRSTEIEKIFFGEIDRNGNKAVEYFSDFSHPARLWGNSVEGLILYMSVQKLRTPKGLEWLGEIVGTSDKERILNAMLTFRGLFGAIWSESVWLIADASNSNTKFIVSDHPVTVYNRYCGPDTGWCRGCNDPDIRLHGTHTIFPLSLDKVLILTNLSWARNPYQSETGLRPNPDFFRGTMFKLNDIQTLRHLSEEEVWEINFVLKSRAYKYIAAAKEEWLYPEDKLNAPVWNKLGDGYLLMPDPRAIHLGGAVFAGFKDGSTYAADEYGRRPGQPGYRVDSEDGVERQNLYRFQAEFARRYGPSRRGRAFNFMRLDAECDSDEMHQYYLGLDGKQM